jgi:diguanylate cyclase (GGDEF)-like protein
MNIDVRGCAGNYEQTIVGAQIEQSYRQLPVSLAVNLVNGLLLTVVLWGAAHSAVLIAWAALLVIVTVGRYLALVAFRDAAPEANFTPEVWLRRFVFGAAAAGLVWGLSAVLLFHPDSFPHQVFLAFALGGMVAGAVPLLSAADYAYPCFTVPIVVPISVQMLVAGDRVHLIMGLMIAVFGIAMLACASRVRGLFRDSARLRYRLLASVEAGNALERLVRLDALTGVASRRVLEEELDKEWRRAERDQDSLSVITADIDHFKEYNDTYGHQAGDRCLQTVAQAMQQALSRPGDVVARIGGEEFAVLLPGTTLAGANAVAESIRRRVLDLNLPHEGSPTARRVTVSFGVACSGSASITTPEGLLHASDVALYEAKRRGRNQVALSEASGYGRLKTA